ncbi:MAG TPA: hypothetical protein VML54_11310 [Candidatus Limnocylindrales bacterium]|nr:hypothetical protein [Candidatus Limnocylindrales bacterium]
MNPRVVVGGTIHPDGIRQLETEARVVVTQEGSEAGMLGVAREAAGILFRGKRASRREAQRARQPRGGGQALSPQARHAMRG